MKNNESSPKNPLLEESVEDLYEEAPCGYLSMAESGLIVRANSTLLNWLGFARSEIVGVKKFQDLLAIGGKIFFETHFGPLIKMQGFAQEINFDISRKDGTTVPVLTSTKKRSSQGSTVYRVTLFDISDRKKYERELLHERKRAEKAAKVKADFLSMMSHEIRTPMNGVIGIVDLLARTDLNSEQFEFVKHLKTSSENLLSLLDNILDFGKLEKGKVKVQTKQFKLSNLLSEVLHLNEPKAAQNKTDLSLECDDTIPGLLKGDPVKISQLLNNLVGNALKFTKDGSVLVKISLDQLRKAEVTLTFQVIDSGIGIPQHMLSQIFDEFTQVDEDVAMTYGGSGLGLAICKKLASLLGSEIQVESEEGKGSTFSFKLTLERCEVETPLRPKRLKRSEGDELRGVHVLVAEDNEENLYILRHLFRDWGVVCEAVSNGKEAVEKVLQGSYDLILMDLRMPIMDGYRATQAIRTHKDINNNRIPIIAFSASTKIGQEDLVDHTDFDDFIGKPFRSEVLFRKMVNLLKK